MTTEEFRKFYKRWQMGEYPHQRLGQAFVNEACSARHSDDTRQLFYEKSTQAAVAEIKAHWLEDVGGDFFGWYTK